MRRRRLAVAALAVAALAGCAAPGSHQVSGPKPALVAVSELHSAVTIPLSTQLHSLQLSHKLFGMSVMGAPASMRPVRALGHRLGRMPDVVEYYQDWADQFDPAAAVRACAAGVRPVLTWESWSWQTITDGQPSHSQPAYSPRAITAGMYDSYIAATARAIKSVPCQLTLRLDQEPNGYWYPWSLRTAGMHNTAAAYVAMWRHVWRIFHSLGVQNVTWVWSPNLVSTHGRPYPLRALYPGNRYVDAVGIDGYLYRPTDTPANVFDPIMLELQSFAGSKPWLVSETGVTAGPDQARQILELLHYVATDKRLIGLIYLDEPSPRADWTFDADHASVRAVRRGLQLASLGRTAG